jgi:hypothetical protein
VIACAYQRCVLVNTALAALPLQRSCPAIPARCMCMASRWWARDYESALHTGCGNAAFVASYLQCACPALVHTVCGSVAVTSGVCCGDVLSTWHVHASGRFGGVTGSCQYWSITVGGDSFACMPSLVCRGRVTLSSCLHDRCCIFVYRFSVIMQVRVRSLHNRNSVTYVTGCICKRLLNRTPRSTLGQCICASLDAPGGWVTLLSCFRAKGNL